MKLIHSLICERCGGTIDRDSLRCPYCDTEYVNRATHKARETFLDKIYLTHKEIVLIEDKNLENLIDTYNDEIQRLQQEAADLGDVKSLRGINLRISSIRHTIELLKKLYKNE